MSDTSQGDGWWLASDGKWYPPQDAPTEAVPSADPGTEATAATAPVAPSDDATQAVPPDEASSSVFPDEPGPDDATAAMPVAAAGVAGATVGAAAGAASGPPPTPPTDGSAGGPGDEDGESKSKGKIIAAIVAVVALAAAAFAFLALTGDEASAGEVVLEPVGTAGPAPFTDPVADVDGTVLKWSEEGPPANVAPATTTGPGDYQEADGNVPGVFGGSLNSGSCLRDQLVAFLTENEDKASAWAGVLDIDPADIGAFVAGLTAINTSTDIRIVNNGFVDGEVEPRESVLQRGTAVLADAEGVPRVNCYSGNPLTAASVSDGEEFTGEPWPAFQQTNVIIINQAPAELTEFELIELTTGELFKRPVGTDGEADRVDGPPTTDVVNDGPIEFDTLISDQLTESRTEARYTMDVPDSAILTITADNQRESIGNVRFILSKTGDRFSDFTLAPGANEEDVVVLAADGGGPFELTATGGPAAYSFTVGLGSQNDAGSGGDAGADLASSLPIATGSFSGQMSRFDQADAFEVEIDPGSDAVFTLASARESEGSVRMIASIDGDRIFDKTVDPGGSEDGSTLLSGVDSGTVLIEITSASTVAYEFSANFVKQTDTDANGDAGDDLASSTAVANPSSFQGEVGDRDAADFFSFSPPSDAGVLEVSSASTSTANVRIIVNDASGSRVADITASPGATQSTDFVGVPGEQFVMQITGGRGAYTGSIR